MTDDLEKNLEAILKSPNYQLPELDTEFLQRDEARPVRVLLELRGQWVWGWLKTILGNSLLDQDELCGVEC